MAPTMQLSKRSGRSVVRLPGQLASFVTYVLAPLLILLATVVALLSLPPIFRAAQGQPVVTHFLAASPETARSAAWAELGKTPTRLTQRLAAGNAWFVSVLPEDATAAAVPQTLLIPSHQLSGVSCWLSGATLGQELQQTGRPLPIEHDLAGVEIALPASMAAGDKVLCHAGLVLPQRLSVERWAAADLARTVNRTSHAIGLIQGGLLTLALFLGVIALTTREWLYLLLGCWLIGNMRLGGWALGWDFQWLGFLIAPEWLAAVRKLTLVVYYMVTYHLFAGLFRESLDPSTQSQIRWTGHISSLLLLAATLALPYSWFQTAVFFAAWLGTGLVAILLIHGLFGAHTRAHLWHTVGVCLALIIMLVGLILVGLDRSDLIDHQTGTIALLLCNILIALAVADQMREDRRVRSRERSDLIAHDSLTPLGLFTLGATRHFEHLNASAREMLQLPTGAEPLGKAWRDYFPPVDWLQVVRATGEDADTEIRFNETDASTPARNFLLRATLAGSRIEGSLQDVTARTETLRNLTLMADRDPLTDTLSHRGIERAMQESLDALNEAGTPSAMALLDLDHVRRINDLLGHTAGDTLLQMVCERIRFALKDEQHLGRVGSDEFVILFPGLKAVQAQEIGQTVMDSLNGIPLHIGERSFQPKAAMGLIDLDGSMRPKDAITAASRACHDARQQHRDMVIYEENASELSEHIDEQHLFEQIEKGGMPRDLHLEMQPILSLRQPLETLDFEILLRVRNPAGRELQTSRVIQAAEDNGIITAIDRWVFTTVLQWLAQNESGMGQTRLVNVNLSGVSLNDDHFMDILFALLGQQPQASRRLCVEITEGVALQDMERTRQFMRRLQRLGARVALDDFGAGYTSFSYLKELPADMIKIDGSLIRDMLASESNIAIVNSIVDLAHNLGMECIAEWVEDMATLRSLSEMGVDHVQGHVVSKAHAPDDMLGRDNILSLVADPAVRSYIAEISGRRT